MKKLNCVLLVDDDSINNFINERLIRKTNITEEVKIVLNGREAIDFLTQSSADGKPSPELILLDINMPVMDGFEFLEAFKKMELKDKSSVIIVMLTTSTNPNDTQRLNNSGVSGYLNKPLTEVKLNEVITKHFS
jgi:CheY-like chemotaxis protein